MLTVEMLDHLPIKVLQDYAKEYGLSHYGTKEKLRRYLREHLQKQMVVTPLVSSTPTKVKITIDQEITMECAIPVGKTRQEFLHHVISFFST